MPNRLANETSPYLLQHKDNPVDWFPWSAEAFEVAAQDDKPIFLSIGYAACHWCHVMERESFEDEEIAHFLNEHFVSIKVDREERPDVDQIYMQAVLALSGHGGWPLSAFLTPNKQFFFGGTYWPPRPSRGMPGFYQVLQSVVEAYQNRRESVEQQSQQITQLLQQNAQPPAGESSTLSYQTLERAARSLHQAFDRRHGGFGSAPKFPHPMDLTLLLRVIDHWPAENSPSRAELRNVVEVSLDRMARGGMYDQVGGGFARYSVDAQWLVPHFEKMLYDNAQLAQVYLEAGSQLDNSRFTETARETLDYLLRDMRDSQGGFHSSEDADSEGEEGKFYVWDRDEIVEILPNQQAESFCELYGVTHAGNFEGRNILHLTQSISEFADQKGIDETELQRNIQSARETLLERRNQRVRPGKDDKVIVSWNGLAIDALAWATIHLDRSQYIGPAREAADFILTTLRRDDGRLLHTWRCGTAKLDAYLDDYAILINALITLYEADLDVDWLRQAIELAEAMIEHFADEENGGFFFTADDHESLVVRSKDQQDTSLPSGNSMAAQALVRLGRLCDNPQWIERAEDTIRAASQIIDRAPMAASQMLIALELLLRPNRQLVLLSSGDMREQIGDNLLDRLRQLGNPTSSLIVHDTSQDHVPDFWASMMAGKQVQEGMPTLYVCENHACQPPVAGREAILQQLDSLDWS